MLVLYMCTFTKQNLFPQLIFGNCKSWPKILIECVGCILHMKKTEKKKKELIKITLWIKQRKSKRECNFTLQQVGLIWSRFMVHTSVANIKQNLKRISHLFKKYSMGPEFLNATFYVYGAPKERQSKTTIEKRFLY